MDLIKAEYKLQTVLILLRNKPIRRPGTTPIGSSTYDDDDSLSVTPAGAELFKWEPSSGAVSVVQTTRAEFN